MFKIRKLFTWIVVIMSVVVIYQNFDRITDRLPDLQEKFEQIAIKESSTSSNEAGTTGDSDNSSRTTEKSNTTHTPIESIVQNVTLSNKYYYRFEQNIPESVQRVFEQAVKVYNATGLVELIAGNGDSRDNSIVFGTYINENEQQNGFAELGKGGPQITTYTSFETVSVNNAIANLNIADISSVRLSVAVHELGHALGLAHSESTDSVMYPLDQGKDQLTNADIAALAIIYPK